MVNEGNSSLSQIKQNINDPWSSCRSNPGGQSCTQLKNQANSMIISNNEYKRRLCQEGNKNNPAELRKYCVGGIEQPEGNL
jgi:hypothetical protein